MTARLRVLHLLHDTGPAASERVFALARALADQGIESEVLCGVAGARAAGAPRDGIAVTEFPWPAGAGAQPEALAAGLRAALGRVGAADVIHAHDLFLAGHIARCVHALTGTPYLASDRPAPGDETRDPGPFDAGRLIAAHGDGTVLLATGPQSRERIAAAAPGAVLRVVPDGVDPAGPPSGRAGELLVVAPGAVSRTAAVPGLNTRVVEGAFRAGELAGAAAVVVPGDATEWALNAAVRGIPVLCPRESAVAELLGAGYPGLLDPAGPLDPLATAVRRLIGEDAPRAVLAETAKLVADRYGWNAAAARHREIYQALLDGRVPSADGGPDAVVRMALPDITSAEVRAASAALYSAKLSAGPHVEAFEQEFAAWHGVPHAVAVNSAAAALFAVVSCAGITGEVLVPGFTWAATANAVVAAGAVPVWVDIEEDTLAIGPEAVAAAIGPRTEAVMPVHYAGHPARTAELAALCDKHGLLLIEDAAEAAGARQNGAAVGSFGVGCFSFYGTKNMTTGGEGGMVTTRDARLAASIRTLRAHGMRPVPGSKYPWRKEAIVPGFNFRMPEPLAAAGRRQLERLEGMNDARRAVAAQYDLALAAALGDRVRPQRELPGFHHVYHMYVARLRDASVRDEAVARLRSTGIEASVHFDPPVHRHDFYASRYPVPGGGLEITDAVAGSVVTLPLSTVMPRSQVQRVVDGLVRVLDELGAK